MRMQCLRRIRIQISEIKLPIEYKQGSLLSLATIHFDSEIQLRLYIIIINYNNKYLMAMDYYTLVTIVMALNCVMLSYVLMGTLHLIHDLGLNI